MTDQEFDELQQDFRRLAERAREGTLVAGPPADRRSPRG
jgi:hypothetical protein